MPDAVLPPGAVPNLRITFWGVQGSCPVFPSKSEIDDFAHQIALDAIGRTLQEFVGRLDRGTFDPTLLRQLASPQRTAQFQREIGLAPFSTFGGDTTCIEVRTAEGNTLVFDMGTGLRPFSRHVVQSWKPDRERKLHIFASHEHLDHRGGLSFASFCFEKDDPFHVNVYGTRQFLTTLDDRYGVFSRQIKASTHADDPLDYRMLSASFNAYEIRMNDEPQASSNQLTWPVLESGVPITVGSTRMMPFEVYHGLTRCLAYKVTHGPSSFVFCTDHELRHGDDPDDDRQRRSQAAEQRLLDQCQNADVAYFDGQYLLAEYLGKQGIGPGSAVSRMDWGHSCVEDVVSRVQQCNIRRAYIGHHDPDRSWSARVELDTYLQRICEGKPYTIELAKAGETIEV